MKNKVTIKAESYFEMVGDGAIADSKTADGKLIPILILDSTQKKEIEYLVKMHSASDVGDVTSIWAIKRFDHKFVTLVLYFTNPIELEVAISFNVLKHSNLIEGILISKAVYIQPGTPGDRVRHNINAPKLLVEIPARTTFENWDEILKKAVRKKLKKEGVGRKALKDAVDDYISVRRDVWGRRLK